MHHDVTVETMVHITKQIHKCHDMLNTYFQEQHIFEWEFFILFAYSCLLTLELFKNLLNFETGWYSFMLRNVIRTTELVTWINWYHQKKYWINMQMDEQINEKKKKKMQSFGIPNSLTRPLLWLFNSVRKRISVTILSLVTEQGFYSTKLWNNVYFL